MMCHCVTQGPSRLRSSVAERTLTKVGRGVTLSVERSTNTAWLYNRSDFAVFILSATTTTVVKLLPAHSACVYRWPAPRTCCPDDDDEGKTDVERSSRQLDCVLVSFVKGWSGRYKRQSILSCPCWLQVILAPSPDGRWNEDDHSELGWQFRRTSLQLRPERSSASAIYYMSVEILSTAAKLYEQEAQLSQRDRATRCVSKFMLFSLGMGVRKVSNSKRLSDLQGHSRALAMMPFDRPHSS